MPQSHNRKPHPLANTTPFPNGLFDWMPELKDSEWRLICLIVRGTWGWKDKNGLRKQSDWLTQKQMMKRTGRSSEALSRAVDSLVRYGLIEVRNADGEALRTAAARRRSGGRLYFNVTAATPHNLGNKHTHRKNAEVESVTSVSGSKAIATQSKIKLDSVNNEVLPSTGEQRIFSRIPESNTGKEEVEKLLQQADDNCRSITNPIASRITKEARERNFRPRSSSGWYHAGDLPLPVAKTISRNIADDQMA